MDKQERIFKLINKDGYICSDSSNRQTLTDNGIFVDGNYYYKGFINNYGDLRPLSGCLTTTLIDGVCGEFEYFEEVDSIPLPKDKPCLENYFVKPKELREEVVSEQAELPNTFTKSMLVSGEHVVECRNGICFLVMKCKMARGDAFYKFSNLNEDLIHTSMESLDIVSVYETTEYFTLYDLSSGENLTLIWQRESPEEEAKRIRKQELEEKVVALRQELKQVENELQEL